MLPSKSQRGGLPPPFHGGKGWPSWDLSFFRLANVPFSLWATFFALVGVWPREECPHWECSLAAAAKSQCCPSPLPWGKGWRSWDLSFFRLANVPFSLWATVYQALVRDSDPEKLAPSENACRLAAAKSQALHPPFHGGERVAFLGLGTCFWQG